jgi:periplasmic protein TonB
MRFVPTLVLPIFLSISMTSLATAQIGPDAGQSSAQSSLKRMKIGGNVAKSMIKHSVAPAYPLEALRARIQGVVRLHAVLSTSGKVQQLEIISGDPLLAKAGLEAVRQWEYKPFLLNGEPVEVDTTIDLVFSLSR